MTRSNWRWPSESAVLPSALENHSCRREKSSAPRQARGHSPSPHLPPRGLQGRVVLRLMLPQCPRAGRVGSCGCSYTDKRKAGACPTGEQRTMTCRRMFCVPSEKGDMPGLLGASGRQAGPVFWALNVPRVARAPVFPLPASL